MKILLADDHALFRDGMHYVLRKLDEKVVILDAGSFTTALGLAKSNPDIDLVLLDLNMPGSEGAPSIYEFHTQHPEMPLVVVSGSDHRNEIEGVMNSGAMGFISKISSAQDMVHALRLVLNGGIYLPPQLLQFVLSNNQVDKRFSRNNHFGLTNRQMEVLQGIALGLSNKEIALSIGLAEGTVKIHVSAIFHTLQVSKRIDAVQAAQRIGIALETSPIQQTE